MSSSAEDFLAARSTPADDTKPKVQKTMNSFFSKTRINIARTAYVDSNGNSFATT
jgi:hypothetical protein